ncbi:Auxin-responsive GH3 family protein [Theobroma cacao]|uniref:Auxin-responsive GH3 family protein n=1 Tax=Theobroma cacao TaxID=3641 RepID=A0A061FEZ1_THECC|nr:Auxin-responsive GH3 family protein [Theobroma cacao]
MKRKQRNTSYQNINQSMYCQLLVSFIQRDEVVRIGSMFASALLRAIKFIEDHWKELCSNIKTGYLSDWITDSGCRNALSLIMKHDPALADSIENICGCRSWEGIIRKLWPKAKYIGAITMGVMRQYTTTLDFYSGGLPLVSSFYACSEAICGINLEPLDKPADVSYTILPNMAYFEFLPVKTMTQEVQFNGVSEQESIEMKSNNEDIEAVDLVNVKLGQFYELVVTTFTGVIGEEHQRKDSVEGGKERHPIRREERKEKESVAHDNPATFESLYSPSVLNAIDLVIRLEEEVENLSKDLGLLDGVRASLSTALLLNVPCLNNVLASLMVCELAHLSASVVCLFCVAYLCVMLARGFFPDNTSPQADTLRHLKPPLTP